MRLPSRGKSDDRIGVFERFEQYIICRDKALGKAPPIAIGLVTKADYVRGHAAELEGFAHGDSEVE